MGDAYTRRLLAELIPATRSVASVPAGQRWVVIDVALTHLGSGPAIVVVSNGLAPILRAELDPDTGEAYVHWEGRQVLDAGEQLIVTRDQGDVYVSITGYEFALGAGP